MTHVETNDIHACYDKFPQHVNFTARRSYRTNYFDATHSLPRIYLVLAQMPYMLPQFPLVHEALLTILSADSRSETTDDSAARTTNDTNFTKCPTEKIRVICEIRGSCSELTDLPVRIDRELLGQNGKAGGFANGANPPA
jgi:hypothetical protein